VNRAIDRREDGARVIEEAAPGREERHPSWCAREERRSELVFEGADLTADGWLGDVEALRRASDVPFFRDRNEVADLNETHATSMSSARRNRKLRRQIEKVLDLVHAPAA
jgi:hypothetical protein